MDVSGPIEEVKTPADPERLSFSDSDGGASFSSADTGPDNNLDIGCGIVEKSNQGIGPWLFRVLTCAFHQEEEEVAWVHGFLIKREEIQARDNKKKSLRMAMQYEDPILNVMFELPRFFHPHGHVQPDMLLPLGQCFNADDMRAFDETKDASKHPANNAWILLIRDLFVDAEYRRLGIGGNMIRKTIQTVLDMCVKAGRPLLVAVQPKRIDEFQDEEWSQIKELVYHFRVNEVFWEEIGFKRYKGRFGGFTAPWYFWGTARRLPSKKRITIPEDVEDRNTRTATPPRRPHTPRDVTQPTPYDYFPVVKDMEPEPSQRSSNEVTPTLLPAPLKNDFAPDNDGAKIRWFDDPDDPSMTPENAHLTRSLMRTLDAVGKKYQVRPLKESVQATAAQSMARQSNCPFKAPSGAVTERPRWLAVLPREPPSPITFHRAAAPEPSSRPARRSVRNQVFSAQPGSRFLVSSDEDDDSDMDDADPDDLAGHSYEDLVANGFIRGDEDDEDEL